MVPFPFKHSKKKIDNNPRNDIDINSDLTDKKNRQEKEETGVFFCTNDLCEKRFIRFQNLENHIMHGTCKVRKHQESVTSWFKREYFNHFSAQAQKTIGNDAKDAYFATHLKTLKPVTVPEGIQFLENSSFDITYEMGYGQPKSTRGKSSFTKEQKAFAKQIFMHGQTTKQKLDPALASERMRKAVDSEGNHLFKPKECLTASQLKGLFSRWMAEAKAQGSKDLDPEQIEHEASDDIESEVNLQTIQTIQSGVNSDEVWMKSHPLEVKSN